jgi:threonine/homoserine/homoserine lactone efflux protein
MEYIIGYVYAVDPLWAGLTAVGLLGIPYLAWDGIRGWRARRRTHG